MQDLIIFFVAVIVGFFILETTFIILATIVNKKFQWLIIKKDETPKLSQDGLKKFFSHGYDPILGWVRKPNTSNSEKSMDKITNWKINSKGSRMNPSYENLPSKISCYGDSFTFARQVNDDETWEHFLSELSNTNVINFGVGNYGLDQSLLRLKREFQNNKTDIVIMGVVPDTISRIVSVWKHYYEYGNTFGFKPRFFLKNDELCLFENPISNKSKFQNYTLELSKIQQYDYFYKQKFKKELLTFPYSFSILKNPKRHLSIIFWTISNTFLKFIKKNNSRLEWKSMEIIMKINLKWRVFLFNDKKTVTLLKKLLMEYVKFSKENNFRAVFVFLPQKDDILFIKSHYHFYQNFLQDLSLIDGLYFIDVLKPLLDENDLDTLYSDNNSYGGHYSIDGNRKISNIIFQEISDLLK